MKKQLLFTFAFLSTFFAFAQNSIPNGNFETWNSAIYDYPTGYPQNSNVESFFRCNTPFNLTQSTDAFNGNFALRLETNASAMDTCGAYLLNAAEANGNPSTWQGGIPYNGQPTGFSGHYKYNQPTGDSALIILVFKNNGTTIGTYFFLMGGNHSSYQAFSFPLTPALPMAADSMIFAAASSNLISGTPIPGSVFLLDSISFIGAGQPADLNGDFEAWQNGNIDQAVSWSSYDSEGRGVAKSTDAAEGTFAVELTTYAGDNNGVPRANAGYIGNGGWDMNCACYVGGNPFTNMIDTLVLSYKYTPAVATDSAFMNLAFKAGGSVFSFFGAYFTASPTYQTVEYPINLFSAPDSVFVQIQSNQYDDTTMNHIGATLLIDDIHFKSQASIGIKKNFATKDVAFFPNPMRSTATILIDKNLAISGTTLLIYDAIGNEVRRTAVSSHKITFEKNELQSGVYIYKLINEAGNMKTGKIVVE